MNKTPVYVCLILTTVVASLLLLGSWMSLPSQAVLAIPAPLPTMTYTPAPKPTSPPPTGGSIELHVQFPEAWPWSQVHWQELWTVVEWQDDKGVWRVIEGWQGTLDDVLIDESGLVWGKKMWWVGVDDLGKGPFRWAIYRSKGGRLLGRSDVFYLPGSTNEIESVGVTLGLP